MFKYSPGKKHTLFRSLLLLLSVCMVQDAAACRRPPRGQLIGVDEHIMRAGDVSVARVVSATPGKGWVEYRFLVLQRLAGPELYTFTVLGGAPSSHDSSFDNHSDPAFWKHGGGRVMNSSDCLIHPSFVLGGTYLVFQGRPATWRNFEKIDVVDGKVNENDRWLAYVKTGLGRRRQ